MTDEEILAKLAEQATAQAAQFRLITDALAALKTAPVPVPPVPVAPPAPPVPPVPPPVPVVPSGLTPEVNAQILDYKKSIEKLTTDMAAVQDARKADQKRAEDLERMNAVNMALGSFQFATDAARQTAVEKILPQIKRTEAGTLVAGENLPPEAFIKEWLPTQHAYLLAPVNTSGSGLTPGQRQQGAKQVDLGSPKPGWSKQEKADYLAAISAALPRN